jgi:hypothetical protein
MLLAVVEPYHLVHPPLQLQHKQPHQHPVTT